MFSRLGDFQPLPCKDLVKIIRLIAKPWGYSGSYDWGMLLVAGQHRDSEPGQGNIHPGFLKSDLKTRVG